MQTVPINNQLCFNNLQRRPKIDLDRLNQFRQYQRLIDPSRPLKERIYQAVFYLIGITYPEILELKESIFINLEQNGVVIGSIKLAPPYYYGDQVSIEISDSMGQTGIYGTLHDDYSYLSSLNKTKLSGSKLLEIWSSFCSIIRLKRTSLYDAASLSCPMSDCYQSINLRVWRPLARSDHKAFYEARGYSAKNDKTAYRNAIEEFGQYPLKRFVRPCQHAHLQEDHVLYHKLIGEESPTHSIGSCDKAINEIAPGFDLRLRKWTKIDTPNSEDAKVHNAFHRFYNLVQHHHGYYYDYDQNGCCSIERRLNQIHNTCSFEKNLEVSFSA